MGPFLFGCAAIIAALKFGDAANKWAEGALIVARSVAEVNEAEATAIFNELDLEDEREDQAVH